MGPHPTYSLSVAVARQPSGAADHLSHHRQIRTCAVFRCFAFFESETASDSACTRVWYGVGNRGGLFSAVNGASGTRGAALSASATSSPSTFSAGCSGVVFVGGLAGHRGGVLGTLDGGPLRPRPPGPPPQLRLLHRLRRHPRRRHPRWCLPRRRVIPRLFRRVFSPVASGSAAGGLRLRLRILVGVFFGDSSAVAADSSAASARPLNFGVPPRTRRTPRHLRRHPHRRSSLPASARQEIPSESATSTSRRCPGRNSESSGLSTSSATSSAVAAASSAASTAAS